MIELADFLHTAGAVLGISPEDALRITDVGAAESALAAPFASFGGVDFYEDPVERAAILASRINRNHPLLVDGNKRVAYLLMIDLLSREGIEWNSPDPKETDRVFRAVASREMSEQDFAEWVRGHTS